jgi:hypothetical protein
MMTFTTSVERARALGWVRFATLILVCLLVAPGRCWPRA